MKMYVDGSNLGYLKTKK